MKASHHNMGVTDGEFGALVEDLVATLDKFNVPAKEKGELPPSADPAVLAQLASATIHSIAIRARARVPRKQLEVIVKGALDVMLRA